MEQDSTAVKNKKKSDYRSTGNGVYGLAFIGAFIYYIVHATSFWMGVLGFIKAVFWPAFLVYHLFEFLKM